MNLSMKWKQTEIANRPVVAMGEGKRETDVGVWG